MKNQSIKNIHTVLILYALTNVLNTIRCAGSECGCHGGSLRQARAARRHAAATAAEALNYAVAATDYYGHTIHPFQLLSFAILVV